MATGESGKGDIRITEVTDARQFMNEPSDPSIPSIDGDVTTMNEAIKSVMIGRQRNTWGQAMGDIALPVGQTVQERTQKLIEEGLKQKGYSISTDMASPNTAKVVVREFWAWFTPGMWGVSFEAKINCLVTITVDGKIYEFTVSGYGKNVGQMASDANWQKAYNIAFNDFMAKLSLTLEKNGL